MKQLLWIVITLVAGVLGFLSGYSVSSYTGVEPGFFAAVETGSYGGGGGESAGTEGVSQELQKYYEGLSDE